MNICDILPGVGGAFGAVSSSSLLDSLELSLLGLAFLAEGPLVFLALLSGALRFLASGDLNRT